MTDWSNHTTVEINRLLSLSEKELLARLVYLLDRLVEYKKEERLVNTIKNTVSSSVSPGRFVKK